MLLLFFGVWIIFNGKVTLEIVLFGVAIAVGMFWFICRFMDYSWKKEQIVYQTVPLFIQYILILIREIWKANGIVCRMILSRREVVEPVLVHVHTNLKSEMARMILANSITLTPGTITVSLTGDRLLVHCLDKSLAEGMEDSVFVTLLEKMEKGASGVWN